MESAENREQPISGGESAENNTLSLSRIETIALLNDSIDKLEQTIKGISENSASMPSSDSINTLLNTTQELADAVTPTQTISSVSSIAEVQETSVTAPDVESVPTASNTADSSQVAPTLKQKKTPPVTKTKRKANLPLIIAVVTAIAIAVALWIWLPRQQANLSSLPESTATEVTDSLKPSDDQDLKAPLSDSPAQLNDPNLTDSLSDIESTDLEPKIPPQILIPANLESPGKVKNLKMVTIKPELSFTPEQTLIASLRSRITQLIQDYPADLVDSVEVDLPRNSLVVKVSDQWYGLGESKQNDIANQILERSRQLSFKKLKLQDSSGLLVARSPVIGEQIVILENSKSNKPLTIDNQEQT